MKSTKPQINPPKLAIDAATHAFLGRNFAKDTTGLVDVTPNLASFLFHNFNTRNRPLSAPVVKQYVHDMQRGAWLDTGQGFHLAYIVGTELDKAGNIDDTPGVRLNAQGFIMPDTQNHLQMAAEGPRAALINGGHRTCALAMLGGEISIPVTIRTGCPLALRALLDNGRRRNNSGQMDLEGIKYAAKLDPITKAIHAVLHYQETDLRVLGTTEAVDDYYVTHRAALEWVCPLFGKTGRAFASAANVAGFALAYDAVVRAMERGETPFLLSALERLANQLKTGTEFTSTQDDPMWAFREFCINRASLTTRPREPRFTMTLRTLNAILWSLTGVSVSALKTMGVVCTKKQFPATPDGLEYFAGVRSGTVKTSHADPIARGIQGVAA